MRSIKIDLWVLIAFLLLMPHSVGISSAPVRMSDMNETGLIINIVLGICMLIYIALLIIFLSRCAILEKYRYLVFRVMCKRKPKHINKLLYIAGLPVIGYMLYVNFTETMSVFLYTTIVLLLSMTFGDEV